MSGTGLAVFDSTIQDTHGWLRAIMEELGWEDRQLAYEALRGVLHALRDYLTVDEGAHLAAQLPMLVRGIYYEGWDPSRVPARDRSRADFLRRVGDAFARTGADIDPERVARAVLGILGARISAGEAAQARHLLPQEVRELWPANPTPGGDPARGG